MLSTFSPPCGSSTWGTILGIVFILSIFCIILHIIYNVRFHPLRTYPGPWWLAASRIPYTFYVLRGTVAQKAKELHDKYGHVVRINPDTLSFTSSRAWPDIYGLEQPDGRGNIPKDSRYYPETHMIHDIGAIILMRLGGMQNVFSDRTHRQLLQCHLTPSDHEACLQKYTNLFISRIQQSQCQSETREVDLTHWLQLLTTDVAGEVILGQKFGGLENGQCQPIIASIPSLARAFASVAELSRYPGILYVTNICWSWFNGAPKASKTPKSVPKQPDNRMKVNESISQVLDGPEDKRLSPTEKEAVKMALIIAGSETTATLLAGSIYLLLKHPMYLSKLTSTLRTQFHTSSDMALSALQEHQYLNAVLKESLRLYPPTPGNLFRRTEKEGHVVMGETIPSKTTLTMNIWAANRSALNFHLPDDMVLERWIQPRPAEYQDDDRSAMKPFSVGPQDCPGRNFAWAEARLVLANMLWNLDLELASESHDWMTWQKVFMFWKKPPLKVRCTPAHYGLNK